MLFFQRNKISYIIYALDKINLGNLAKFRNNDPKVYPFPYIYSKGSVIIDYAQGRKWGASTFFIAKMGGGIKMYQ